MLCNDSNQCTGTRCSVLVYGTIGGDTKHLGKISVERHLELVENLAAELDWLSVGSSIQVSPYRGSPVSVSGHSLKLSLFRLVEVTSFFNQNLQMLMILSASKLLIVSSITSSSTSFSSSFCPGPSASISHSAGDGGLTWFAFAVPIGWWVMKSDYSRCQHVPTNHPLSTSFACQLHNQSTQRWPPWSAAVGSDYFALKCVFCLQDHRVNHSCGKHRGLYGL